MLCKWFTEFSWEDFYFLLIEHSGLCDWKRNRKIPRKNVNVAIKRVKSNAPVLALSSDSNIDEVNLAKVSKNTLLFIRNVEFLEVAYSHIFLYIISIKVYTNKSLVLTNNESENKNENKKINNFWCVRSLFLK